jgi:hypothetical protein
MSKKKNSSKKSSPFQDKKISEVLDTYEDDFEDVQYTLREFDFSRKNFYCFSSDDFE